MSWKRLCTWLVAAAILPEAGVAAQDGPPAASTDRTGREQPRASAVRVRNPGSEVLFNVDDVARALNWQAKVVRPGKLMVFCREEPAGGCIPIQLDSVKAHSAGEGLYVEAEALSRALRFSYTRDGRLTPATEEQAGAGDDEVPAYHAAWGEGRGFRVGQTLPDIPLFDVQGREVRFSQFLGKRYILYCWASW